MTGSTETTAQATLLCTPTKVDNDLIFPYVVSNDGPGDIYVADAFHRVDPVTHAPAADRESVVIMLQADGYVLILRGVPPLPPFPVMRRIFPLVRRLGPGERLERQISIPLPLAETSPYQPYGNVRDYVLKPINGVVIAVDWIASGTEGLTATPAVGAEDLFSVYAPNLAQAMQRLTCRYPTKGLSILQRRAK